MFSFHNISQELPLLIKELGVEEQGKTVIVSVSGFLRVHLPHMSRY